MPIMLYARAAPTRTVRVWFGVTGCKAAPALEWTLDGAPASPLELRSMRSVRQDALLPDPGAPRVFSGVYEFGCLPANRVHDVAVRVDGVRRSMRVRTLPDRVPEGGLHILLCSCFHAAEARGGRLRAAVASLQQSCRLEAGGRRPDLGLLLGDQVYLDLPTFRNLPKAKPALAEIFEAKYLANWRENGNKGFDCVLAAAPFVAVPDDHEYWNNYPHKSPIIENSWTAEGRREWQAASDAMVEGFQAPLPEGRGAPVMLTIPPVSLFIADTRSGRTEKTFMSRHAIGRLRQWITTLNKRGYVGVFVSGQSMYAAPAGTVARSVGDKQLSNYEDFDAVIDALTGASRPMILVTGDVHWGRVVESRSRYPGRRGNLYEVIVSPAALVTSVGVDTWKRVRRGIAGLFGKKDPWPRHSDPDTKLRPPFPPYYERHEIVQTDGSDDGPPRATLRGDQIGLLSFGWRGTKLTAGVRYWSLDGNPRPAVRAKLF